MFIRGLLLALLLLMSAGKAAADPISIGAQVGVDYPGSSGPEFAPDGPFTFSTDSPQSVMINAQDTAIAAAYVDLTGSLLNQSLIVNSLNDGAYQASSTTAYRVEFTPTTTGPLTITFHILPQTLQVLADTSSLAQIQTNVFIGGTQLLSTNDQIASNGAGGFTADVSGLFTGAGNLFQAAAYDFSIVFSAIAGQTFTLEYNIQTFVSALFEPPGPTSAGVQQTPLGVLAQFGDPLALNNDINIRFDAATAEVPEPTTLVSLLVMGVAATLGAARFRRRAA